MPYEMYINYTAEQILERLSEWNSLTYQVLKEFWVDYIKELMRTPTPYWSSFIHIIASGLCQPKCDIWLYIDWKNTYSEPLYAKLIDRIIFLYHKFNRQTDKHTEDFNINDLELIDFNKNATNTCEVLSMRVRYAFCLDNTPFQSAMNRTERKEWEKMITDVLNTLDGDVKWFYESLETMSTSRKNELIEKHFLSPTEEDEFLINSNITSDRPIGRGIYLSEDNEFFVLVNDEDNRIGVLKKWGDIKSTFNKLAKVSNILNNKLSIARDEKLGKLVSCPTNIWTGMRLSAMVTLPNLVKRLDDLKRIAKHYWIAIRGHYWEHSAAWSRWEVDVSNKARLWISEKEIVLQVYNWVNLLMKLEHILATQPWSHDDLVNSFMNENNIS
jgi:protein-arginine kinase